MTGFQVFPKTFSRIKYVSRKVFQNEILFSPSLSFKNFYVNNRIDTISKRKFVFQADNISHRRYCIKDCNQKSETKHESNFMQSMAFRKNQALRSVLLELPNKDTIPQAIAVGMEFGSLKNMFSYAGSSNNVFLLLEFEEEESAQNILKNCHFQNQCDSFPAFSRIIRFEQKRKRSIDSDLLGHVKSGSTEVQSNNQTVSEMMDNLFQSEKISELGTRLRFLFCALLKDSISGLFPFSDFMPFGSSVNGLGRDGCDLDVMIRLYPDTVNKCSELYFWNRTCLGDVRSLQQKTIWGLGDYFRTFVPGITAAQKILHARVPILKFKHTILKMDCDISVNNMSAILMSEMLFFCGEVDSRVRPLIHAVKTWAKGANVTDDAPGAWITNFGLSLLVIFFLQNRPLPILPPLNNAMEILGAENDSNFKLNYLIPISELQSKASQNNENLAELLKEFLAFMGEHPFEEKHFSVLSGVATPKIMGDYIWVQYPLEEDKNVTKNVSSTELWDMCEKAAFSSKSLELKLNARGSSPKDFLNFLGVQSIRQASSHKSKKLDLGALLNDGNSKNSKGKVDKRRALR